MLEWHKLAQKYDFFICMLIVCNNLRNRLFSEIKEDNMNRTE